MNRADFMNQLESLLQGVASSEREEAIQYYNDYFDDAGAENEQAVIEALGNPARVAENIRRDLLDSGYGKKPAGKAKASDRALMEYGQDGQEFEADEMQSANDAIAGPGQKRQQEASAGAGQGYTDATAESARASWNPFEEGYGRSTQDTPPMDEDAYRWSHDTAGWFGEKPEKPKRNMPIWAVALLVTVLIFAFPFLGGLFMGLIGIILGWFGVIFGIGVASAMLLLVFLVLVIVGIICLFVNPWVGIALVGGGLVVGCFGILLLMLTVAMAGIVTPGIFRGISALFRFIKRKCKAIVMDL